MRFQITNAVRVVLADTSGARVRQEKCRHDNGPIGFVVYWPARVVLDVVHHFVMIQGQNGRRAAEKHKCMQSVLGP